MKLFFICEECNMSFQADLDHGKPRRFCSRDCFRAKAHRRIEKPCEKCGIIFNPRKDSSKFCSFKCRDENLLKGQEETCIWCGNLFYRRPSSEKYNKYNCCSNSCRKEFYKEERSPAFKSGVYVDSGRGEKFTLIHREGWISKYMGEHRLIVSKIIGRMLTRKEYVLRINKNPQDNSAENLFICDISEFCQMRNGSLPWPEASNLSYYR